MWAWFIGGSISLIVLLIVYVGHKAASAKTKDEHEAAYRVLKLVLASATAVCFALAAAMQQGVL